MTKCGFVYIDGKFRPFETFREIPTGKARGRFEIPIQKAIQSQDRSWQIRPVKRIVHREQITRFPGPQDAEQKAG